jgi:PKD repeat protein
MVKPIYNTSFFHLPMLQKKKMTYARLVSWVVLSAGAMLSSCNKEEDAAPRPVAAFTYTGGACTTACPVTLQNTSQNASSYAWDFGDGSTGTQAEAQFAHSFAQAGSYTVKLTATGKGGSDVTTRVVIVGTSSCQNPSVVQVNNSISQPTTWESCKVYVVNGNLGVSSTLTIQPGAIVKFKTSASGLTLTSGGVIQALGTATEPVVFTSYLDDSRGGDTNGDGTVSAPAKKSWNSISLNSQGGSRFEYCHFLYGGNNTHATTLSLGTVMSSVRNCTFARNAGAGTYEAGALEAQNAAAGTVIQSNVFYLNELPLSISNYFDLDNSNTFHNPAVAAEVNDYNGIWVLDGSSGSPSLSWSETEVPYVLGTVAFDAPLALAAGVMVKFDHLGRIQLNGNGRLLARGTATQPVVFTSYLDDATSGDTNHDNTATTAGKRDWNSILLNATTGSVFDYCQFRYGGQGGSTLDMHAATATVSNSTFAHNGEDVAVVTKAALDAHTAAASTIIQNNTFYDNIRPLSITSSIDLDNSNTFQNPGNAAQKNTYQGIVVDWDSNVSKANVVWRETELAYVNNADIDIASGKTLELGSNVTVKFMAGRRVTMRDAVSQLINATGTGVRFTSVKDDTLGGDSNGNGAANAPAVGDWIGIYLDELPGVWQQWGNIAYDSH